jgi:conjugative coupling factor TraD (TOL family)
MTDRPVEALLRSPVEYFSALAYLCIGCCAALAPQRLLMTPSVAFATAASLFALGVLRGYQGFRIHKYQKGLRRLKAYSMSSRQMPISYSKLFLGRGFLWDGRHTQRLFDLSRKDGRRYKEQPRLYRWARSFELLHERFIRRHAGNALVTVYIRILYRAKWYIDRCRINPLCPAIRYILANNPLAPLPPVGGDPTLHAVGLYEGERAVYMDLGDRVGHTLVLGTTRVGKTRLAELLISQDIHRGDVVVVFDPKGDAGLFKRMYFEAKRAGRLDNFYFFHLGYPEISARYNPVGSYSRITEVASRIGRQLPGEGQSAAFREFVWRYVNVIAKALNSLGRKVDYEQILDFGQDIEPLVRDYMELLAQRDDPSGQWTTEVDYVLSCFEDGGNKEYRFTREQQGRDHKVIALMRYVKDKQLFDPVAKSLSRTYEYDRGYFDRLVSSLLPLMEKLTSGKCSELLSPDYLDQSDTRPIFTWSEIIRSKGIVYIGLDALTDPEVSAAVGNAMFSDLTSTSGRIYKHGPYEGLPDANINQVALNIHADEFNELIGDEFIPMLNKAGGCGYQVTAYTQTWSDVEARLQDRAKAGQVAGNFNSLLMLRVRESETAKMLTEHLHKVDVTYLMPISGFTDSSDPHTSTDFVSRSEHRIMTQQLDLIQINNLTSLPKGQCFALLDGGKPFKIRLPMADTTDLAELPSSLRAVAEDMQSQYATSEDWYSFTPSWDSVKGAS